MFKRARWLLTGAIGGAVATITTTRKVKRQVEQLAPTHVAKRAIASASGVSESLAGRVRDGREQARSVESQLRDRWIGPAKK
jgi:hypothetical protein